MANYSIIPVLVITLSIFFIRQSYCQSNDVSLNDIYYSVVVNKNLLDDILPVWNDTSTNQTNPRIILKNIIRLYDMYNVLDTINSPQHADNIKGLKVLVGEVMSDACDWIKATFKGIPNFQCNDSSYTSLKTKLNLYDQLKNTEDVLKEKTNCNAK